MGRRSFLSTTDRANCTLCFETSHSFFTKDTGRQLMCITIMLAHACLCDSLDILRDVVSFAWILVIVSFVQFVRNIVGYRFARTVRAKHHGMSIRSFGSFKVSYRWARVPCVSSGIAAGRAKTTQWERQDLRRTLGSDSVGGRRNQRRRD